MRGFYRVEDEVEKVKAKPGEVEIEPIAGYMLHVEWDPGQETDSTVWAVWLNTEVAHHDGLVLGIGSTKALALAQAVQTIEAIHDALQGDPSAWSPSTE